jgi:hypothetical protein
MKTPSPSASRHNELLVTRLIGLLRPALWLCAVLALACSLAACKKKAAGDDAANTPPPEPPPKEEPPVELKANWQVGKKFVMRYEMMQELDIQNPNLPTPDKIESLQSHDMAIAVVKDREGGGRELEVEFLAFKVEGRRSGRTTQFFDSKSDPKSDVTNRANAHFRKLVGAKLKYLTDPAGKVDRVEGAAELLPKLLAGTPSATQVALRAMFGEEGLKKMLPGATGLPDKPVKKDETWPLTQPLTIPPFSAMSLEVTNTFKGMEDHAGRKCAAIDRVGGIVMPTRTAPAGAAAPMLEDASVKGSTWFDPALGTIVQDSVEVGFTFKSAVVTTSAKNKVGTKLLQVSDLAGGAVETLQGMDTKTALPPAAPVAAPVGVTPPPTTPRPATTAKGAVGFDKK